MKMSAAQMSPFGQTLNIYFFDTSTWAYYRNRILSVCKSELTVFPWSSSSEFSLLGFLRQGMGPAASHWPSESARRVILLPHALHHYQLLSSLTLTSLEPVIIFSISFAPLCSGHYCAEDAQGVNESKCFYTGRGFKLIDYL